MLIRHLLKLAARTRWGVDDRRAGPGGTPLQVAALPYRVGAGGALEILLVTSRTSQRWIIPKGWPVKGLSLPDSAAREAYEEAGVRGVPGDEAIGSFDVQKPRDMATRRPVLVFPLDVRRTLAGWPEASQRRRVWLPQAQAVQRIDHHALKEIINTYRAPDQLS